MLKRTGFGILFWMKMLLGKRIRALRIEKNLSLPDLAEKASVSKGFLSQLENDEDANPSLDSLNKVAKGLGVTLATILDMETTKARRIVPEKMHPGLTELIEECNSKNEPIDEGILQALYVLQQRKGETKKTKEDWRWLYESIKRGDKR